MKNGLLLIPIIVVFGFCSTFSQNIWTKEDKYFLLNELKKTKSEVLSEVNDLDEFQIFYKPDSNFIDCCAVNDLFNDDLLYSYIYGNPFPCLDSLTIVKECGDPYIWTGSSGTSNWSDPEI
jgi:hypothetical protein